ncbi:MAG: hypothetical protein WD696_02255 [Bryobacteraceae bacterium]
MIVGRRTGGLGPFRVLNYFDTGDDNRRACSLYLSLMDRIGMQLERFGDTGQRLTDL